MPRPRPRTPDHHPSLCPSLRRVGQFRHQLKGRQVRGQAEDVSFRLLQRIDEEHLQHCKVEVVQHVDDAASHQHPDNIGMNEDGWNLGEVEKFYEQRWQGEPEPRIELFLGEEDSTLFSFLSRHHVLPMKKINNYAIWNAKSISKLLYAQFVCRFLISVAGVER